MKISKLLLSLLLILSSYACSAATLDRAAVQQFIDYMSNTHGFDAAALAAVFAETNRSDKIVELISKPAEKVKPWWEYRKLFISDQRIRDGVAFWNDNKTFLDRASAQYGVPPEVVIAIIGVETSYGRITGGYRVIDALATLAFHYPGNNERRATFFRAQLEHFLLFTREDGLDPLSLTGSYAGAMGMPQFMPENYRKLAVDFDTDGSRNIWTDPADAIGSVANYLHHHGWVGNGRIMSPAKVVTGTPGGFAQSDLQPERTLSELKAAGITPTIADPNGAERVALFELEGRDGFEYWITYTNFYVISRYNPRLKYTMAVAQLADAIRDQYYGTER